jgi:hypothetical protein
MDTKEAGSIPSGHLEKSPIERIRSQAGLMLE